MAKDGEILPMTVDDYLGDTIELLWKDTTPLTTPHVLRLSVVASGAVLTDEVEFLVERAPKAQKFYADDLLMENHNNWHSV